MTKTWTAQYSPTMWEQIKAEAQAEAEEYRTGRKIRRWESPRMIAQFGREPWPAEEAATKEYEARVAQAATTEKYPTNLTYKHYSRKFHSNG